MNKAKVKFLVLAMGLFVLSACQTGSPLSGGQISTDSEAGSLTGEQLTEVINGKTEGENIVSGQNLISEDEELTEQEKLLKLQDQLNAIVISKDIKKCAEIKDPIYFQSCNVHILANLAKEEKKPDACEKAINQDIKATCLLYYNESLKPVTVTPQTDVDANGKTEAEEVADEGPVTDTTAPETQI